MRPLEIFNLPSAVVEIHLDPHPKNPLEATIRLGRMVFWTTRLRFREFVPTMSEDQFLLQEMAKRERDLNARAIDLETVTKAQLVAYFRENYCILQIHAAGHILSLQHSAQPQRSREPIGIAICSLEDAQAAFGAAPLFGWGAPVQLRESTTTLHDATLSTLQSELQEYSAFVCGEVYGYKAFSILPDGSLRPVAQGSGFYGQEGRLQALKEACMSLGAPVPVRMAA
jgi:hypothetical protein